MTECTVIAVWNNEEMFLEFEQQLRQQQDVKCTLLGIDNRNGTFSGIREAFNACAEQVSTELVLFAHQDIRFLAPDSLHKLLQQLNTLGQFGVVGVAGCPAGGQWELLSTIVHGEDKKPAGKPITGPQQVQAVDECLFAMQTKVFRQLRFTGEKGWHLYAVEQCIRAEQAGLKNYVVPAAVYHLSDGKSLDPSYMVALRAMGRTYRLGVLNTTVKQWVFNTAGGRFYMEYYYWKQKLKQFLVRNRLLRG